MQAISKTEAKIINYLHKNKDREPYPAEIMRDLGLAKGTAYMTLDSLEEKNIVEKVTKGQMKFYRLNKKWEEVAEAAKSKLFAETDEALSAGSQKDNKEAMANLRNRGELLSREIESFLSSSLKLNLLSKDEVKKLKEAQTIVCKGAKDENI